MTEREHASDEPQGPEGRRRGRPRRLLEEQEAPAEVGGEPHHEPGRPVVHDEGRPGLGTRSPGLKAAVSRIHARSAAGTRPAPPRRPGK